MVIWVDIFNFLLLPQSGKVLTQFGMLGYGNRVVCCCDGGNRRVYVKVDGVILEEADA